MDHISRLFQLALVAWFSVTLSSARTREQAAASFSIDLTFPRSRVVEIVRDVVNNGVILGTFEYRDLEELPGAESAGACPYFKAWSGDGEVFCKIRRKVLSPAHFIGSNDMGTVAVRYVVQAKGTGSTRLTIDAIFVEDARARDHRSDGFVENTEFELIQQRLRGTAETASQSEPQKPESPPVRSEKIDSVEITGAIATDAGAPEESKRATAMAPALPMDQSKLGFSVSREQIFEFAGDWPQLKYKKALFVFAQSQGPLPDLASDDRKFVYAKQIFADRYRAASLVQDPFEGVVVIFVGGKGGIAAATMRDIKQWVQGSLTDEAFANRCSLDPPSEFRPAMP